jgi:hypothetical protein
MSYVTSTIYNGTTPVRSKDGLIIISYSVIAIGALIGLHFLSGSLGAYPANFELATVLP